MINRMYKETDMKTMSISQKRPPFWLRIVLSTIVLLIAIIRFIYFDTVSEKIDSTFLLLLALAILIPVIPWERITSIKAGGVELTLSEPQVKGAIDSLELDRVQSKDLRKLLLEKAEELEQVIGSRILWIDDYPNKIIGERRL